MNNDFGSIKPIDLTDNRKREIEAQMALACDVLKDAVWAIYQSDDPADVKRLREEHFKHRGTSQDPLRRYTGARRCIAGLHSIAEEVLSGYIKTLAKMCYSFEMTSKKSHLPGLDFCDLVDEAAWAIWDSMFIYNGNYQFTTLIYRAAKNRMSTLLRDSSLGSKIRSLKTLVCATMAQGLDFEDAVHHVIKEEKLDDALATRLQQALALTRAFTEDEDPEFWENDKVEKREEDQKMRAAVQKADLTLIQRELVEAHLRGDNRFRAECQKRINPSTGNPYTRAWLSRLFVMACEEIRDCYENPDRRSVA